MKSSSDVVGVLVYYNLRAEKPVFVILLLLLSSYRSSPPPPTLICFRNKILEVSTPQRFRDVGNLNESLSVLQFFSPPLLQSVILYCHLATLTSICKHLIK